MCPVFLLSRGIITAGPGEPASEEIPTLGSVPSDAPDLVAQRVEGAVAVARAVRSSLALDTLVELLPENGPRTAPELETWLLAHPTAGRTIERWAPPPHGIGPPSVESRHQRAEQYCRAAERLLETRLRSCIPWLRVLAVTGSTAYGEPAEGDDCDLMAIARPGAVWLFLAFVFLRLRLRDSVSQAAEPAWCFNYTLDERAADTEYARPRGFLFAREALVARPLIGRPYYRTLLGRAGWLKEEAPRLYARWEAEMDEEHVELPPTPRALRLVNLLLFPVLAAYLHLKGLRANHRLRAEGRAEASFRTITRLDRVALETAKFERLSSRMAAASRIVPG